ncbi:MAG: hypothetical protein ACD_78C00446G0002 [uncultured bacterium (gcode 4)]|uniref:Uncharacterized protein n=1 Tax=uncultured bacterium (gcode 4) TaxID=1234023 RepID=K1XVP4_9BACT|nr:MAG: hypothetical protein ACD_78C00446G0002 [uncultured bacterium (gcode 4)]
MKPFKNTSLYSRLALITSVTLVVGYFVVYAAWSSLSLSDVDAGDAITATLMQNIVNKINDVWTRTDGIYSSAGNIGIGIASPGYKLEISENRADWATRIVNSNTNALWLVVNNTTASDTNFILGAVSNGSYKFLVRNDGNVWIGTASPTYKLSLTQGVGVITNSTTVNDYYVPVTTGGAKLWVPDNVVTPLFKSWYDTVFTLHIVAKEPWTNSLFSKTYAVSILYGSPLITQIQSNSYSTTISSISIAYDNPTRTIRATIDTTWGQATNVYWSINGIWALTEWKFEIQ